MNIRVGFGFDVHRLEVGRPLYLGGIALEAERGAVGHSDADTMIHAICDALLGAANLEDIGYHYSNTDPRWKNKDSIFFLADCIRMLHEKKWSVVNVDCTVCIEMPMISPHIQTMKAKLAPVLQIDIENISIKATTSEKMGFVGRTEGVTAYAVALIQK